LKILAYLLKEEWPVTTEMIAKAIPSSWNTAQLHLYNLVSESESGTGASLRAEVAVQIATGLLTESV
jgi:hypothetical protein